MRRMLPGLSLPLVCLLWGGVGCARLAPSGPALFGALEEAASTACVEVEPSVVLVKLQREQSGGGVQKVGGMTFRTGGTGPKQYIGVALDEQGHILVTGKLEPDITDRIEVLVGDSEYPARPIKVDDQLGMSILKIEADEPLAPLNLDDTASLRAGAWAVMTTPTDESRDYEKLLSLAFCRGEQAGRYRKFLLNMVPRGVEGAPVVDLSGKLVGLASSGGGVLAMADLRADLQDFLAEASGVLSPEEAARSKGWLGLFMEPVNKQYAKAHDLPAGALWVVNVVAGGPSDKAGLRPGDLILALNGGAIRFSGRRALDYFQQSLRPRIDMPFEITVLREGAEEVCRGTFGKKPEPDTLQAEDLGISVSDVTEADVFSMNLFVEEGVRVTDVERGGAAATSSSFGRGLLSKGDIIVEVAGQPTPNVKAFANILDNLRRERAGAVLVRYWRGRLTGYAGLNLTLGEKTNGDHS